LNHSVLALHAFEQYFRGFVFPPPQGQPHVRQEALALSLILLTFSSTRANTETADSLRLRLDIAACPILRMDSTSSRTFDACATLQAIEQYTLPVPLFEFVLLRPL
jgi:hypothetical protein